jgi:hypothetical protein
VGDRVEEGHCTAELTFGSAWARGRLWAGLLVDWAAGLMTPRHGFRNCLTFLFFILLHYCKATHINNYLICTKLFLYIIYYILAVFQKFQFF